MCIFSQTWKWLTTCKEFFFREIMIMNANWTDSHIDLKIFIYWIDSNKKNGTRC